MEYGSGLLRGVNEGARTRETMKLARQAGALMERAARSLGERLPKGVAILETRDGQVVMSPEFNRLMRKLELKELAEGNG